MVLTSSEVIARYPIHWLVWNNQHEELKRSLEADEFTLEDIEVKDTRGRTPLLLAVTLGYTEVVKVLVDAGADINCEKDGWTAVQEATATGDAELLSLVLTRRDFQRHALRSKGIPDLLRRLSLAPDFYVEMKWEFTSWVPLVSRVCPFDTYKVYKRGGNVRVDTTLVGFESNRWQRGDRTYIFRGQGEGGKATLLELDHELGTSWCEYLEPVEESRPWPRLAQSVVNQRLAAPIAINYFDTDKISFERNKSGIWGWRSDKTEQVNGYECKVFGANNVELVSKTRSEHLPRGNRAHAQAQASRAPLAGLLALADSEPATPATPLVTPDRTSQIFNDLQEEATRSRSRDDLTQPVSWEEYFSDAPLERDIGRPREINTKVQKFKATLWLSVDTQYNFYFYYINYFLTISSPHFTKLKDFIQMQLPAGFPIKIEIPLFHVLNARITFGNIFATETPVPHIECIQEGERLSCVVDDQCFAIGRGYTDAARYKLAYAIDDDERLLQYAIQQSVMEAGTHDDQVDVWEALRGARPASPASARDRSSSPILAHEERQLQKAIEASLWTMSISEAPPPPVEHADDPELREALELSVREHATRAQQLEEEQRALDEALRLSLLDK
ncbi:hypothetical protein K1T71_008021 [Dendrolimus kikuchii]|uniref:Uncharacterized protein n=1 Tax=Dendrolimus kikuchii TaxID=765133 RepID=A0ACC1D0B3_9NEOP|nr:hypothetical protein K1T71_008021 [Dendrolimus kikuchii]